MLEITVGDGAVWVFGGDQAVLDFLWEWVTPDVALAGSIEEDPTHTSLCRVGGSNEQGVFGDDFGEVGGP